MIEDLGRHGMTVPMWFCPVRPNDVANEEQQLGRKISDLEDLREAVRYNTLNFGVIYHSVWIPRDAGSGGIYPNRWNTVLNRMNINANENFDWPSKTSDRTVTLAPIMTDRVIGSTKKVEGITGGHPSGNRVVSANLLFGDGHVETRNTSQMDWRWRGTYYCFY